MRPKRVILCVSADDVGLSRRAFLLQTWGYKALTASTAKEALAILSNQLRCEVDLILIDLPLLDFTPKTLAEAKQLDSRIHTLITRDHAACYDSYGADVALCNGCDSAAELRERIRILVARKRGPRKKPSESAIQLVSKPAIRRVA